MKIDPYIVRDDAGNMLVCRSGSREQCAFGLECRRRPVAVVSLEDPLPDPHLCRKHVDGFLWSSRDRVRWLRDELDCSAPR